MQNIMAQLNDLKSKSPHHPKFNQEVIAVCVDFSHMHIYKHKQKNLSVTKSSPLIITQLSSFNKI